MIKRAFSSTFFVIIECAKETTLNKIAFILMIFYHQVLKSAKDLILRLHTEDESSKSLAAAMEEVNYNQLIIIIIIIRYSSSSHCHTPQASLLVLLFIWPTSMIIQIISLNLRWDRSSSSWKTNLTQWWDLWSLWWRNSLENHFTQRSLSCCKAQWNEIQKI